MIFLKAIIFACVICFLENLIICLVWRKSSSLMFEFLPYLLAFFSLSLLFFIKILPYHPVWLLLPIGMQALLVAGTNSLLERGVHYFGNSEKESIFSFPELSFFNMKDRVAESIIAMGFLREKNEDDSETESEKKNSSEGTSQKEQDILGGESEETKEFVTESEYSGLSSQATEQLSASNMTSQENTESTEEEPENSVQDASLDEQENESCEILFLQADIFFVQGEIKENKKILFYIFDKYADTEVGNRAKKELLRLYGEEVFLEERLNIE